MCSVWLKTTTMQSTLCCTHLCKAEVCSDQVQNQFGVVTSCSTLQGRNIPWTRSPCGVPSFAKRRSATIMAPKPASSRWLRSFRLRLALRPQGVDSTACVIIMIDINTGSCALSMTCVDEQEPIVTVGLKCRCVICISSHKSLCLASTCSYRIHL